jgi:predicted phage tail component-like protein
MAIPKNRTIINIDDYTGFRWNGKHTSQLGLTVVSSSSRYSLNPISTIKNNTTEIPGSDGEYFFNSTYGPKKWTINFVFDNLDDYQWRDLLRWLYHTELSDLVFDELPYKAYNAKLEGTPSINYLCFDETRAKQNDNSIDINTLQTVDWASLDSAAVASPSYITETDKGNNFDTMYYKKRIYKGEGTLNFIAPYPFAYSARNYDGRYMKYLDEVEYFPNLAESYSEYIEIDHTNSIAKQGKFSLQLDSIRGNTIIDFDSNSIERGALSAESDGTFSIDLDNKRWVTFNLANKNEIVTLDRLKETSDTIEYIEKNQTYKLIKRVNSINLLEKEEFIKQLNSNFELETISSRITVNLQQVLTTEEWNNLEVDLNNIDNLEMECNQFKRIDNPGDDDPTEEGAYFFIKDATRKNSKNKKLRLNITFIDTTPDKTYFNKMLELSKTTNINQLEQPEEACVLLYPQKEQEYELLVEPKIDKPFQQNFNDIILVSCRNTLGSKVDLAYGFDFTFTPALYDNYNEWADSSGLKESQYIEEENVYYDRAADGGETGANFSFKVYNGGDLDTPFRVTLPIVNKEVKSDKSEISFILAKVESDAQIDIDKYERISNVVDLKPTVAYGVIENEQTVEYKYYFYKVLNYAQNTAQFIDIISGEFKDFNLSNQQIIKKTDFNNNLSVIKNFSIRFYNDDALNSYADIIKQYTAALATQQAQDFTCKLEIDTYKQSVNFIITSQTTGEDTIIPCYFMVSKGELFTIPPEVDNLYLLVYNQRDEGNSFIQNNYKKIPDIEYRYLYL